MAKSERKAAVYFNLTANQSNSGNAFAPTEGTKCPRGDNRRPAPSIAFLQGSEVLLREQAHRSQLESDYYREALDMVLQRQQRPRRYTLTRMKTL